MGEVEPHLRTEGEIRELQPRVDFMAQRMCQTQGMVLWALKEAGLTVVLLDPHAREIAPDDVSDQAVFVGRTKRVTPLTDAELNYSPEEWAEALAEDPSCIRAYLEAAEERGRRSAEVGGQCGTMNDFSEKQIETLLEWMPALMAYLRTRSEANDADAKALFDELDSYCWHQPICGPGIVCAGGKPRAAGADR